MSVLFIFFMHVAGIRDTLSAYQSLKQRLAFHLRAIKGEKKVKLNVIIIVHHIHETAAF